MLVVGGRARRSEFDHIFDGVAALRPEHRGHTEHCAHVTAQGDAASSIAQWLLRMPWCALPLDAGAWHHHRKVAGVATGVDGVGIERQPLREAVAVVQLHANTYCVAIGAHRLKGDNVAPEGKRVQCVPPIVGADVNHVPAARAAIRGLVAPERRERWLDDAPLASEEVVHVQWVVSELKGRRRRAGEALEHHARAAGRDPLAHSTRDTEGTPTARWKRAQHRCGVALVVAEQTVEADICERRGGRVAGWRRARPGGKCWCAAGTERSDGPLAWGRVPRRRTASTSARRRKTAPATLPR